MTNLELMELIKTIMTVIAGFAAITAAIFAFLNWRRAKLNEAPRAFLECTEPNRDGVIETEIIIENRSATDIRVDSVHLACGFFCTGVVTGSGLRPKEFKRGTADRMKVAMLVVSGDKRSVNVVFHVEPPEVQVVLARLVLKGSGYIVCIDESK